jgi:hypothetical protein
MYSIGGTMGHVQKKDVLSIYQRCNVMQKAQDCESPGLRVRRKNVISRLNWILRYAQDDEGITAP